MSQDQKNPLRQEKIKKSQELVKRKVKPYPHKWNKKRSRSTELLEIFKKASLDPKSERSSLQGSESSKKVAFNSQSRQSSQFHIAGRLMRKRSMGKAAFFNIQDEAGEFQCYIREDDFLQNSKKEKIARDKKPESPATAWEIWKLSDIGDILGLSGELFQTKRGETSLRVKDLQMLCKSLESLPEKYHGLEDKELKYRYRHLDLIMSRESREVFKIRSKIIWEIRSFMHKKNFMEVETPVLQPLYGGAAAAPFETYFRRLSHQKMYLKISPEIYLKKLLVGGFEKVFEIGKNFRNEGIDRSHNPEFTMMEYYEAYTDYEDQMEFFEELICHVAKTIQKQKREKKQELSKEFQNQKIALDKSDKERFLYQGHELNLSRPWTRISPKQFEALICARGQSSKESTASESFVFQYQGRNWTAKDFFKEINQNLELERENKKKLDFKKFWKNLSENIEGKKEQKGGESKKRQLLKDYKLLLNYTKFIDPNQDLKKFEALLSQSALSLTKDSTKDLTDKRLSASERIFLSYKSELSLLALEWTVEKYFWNPIFIIDFPIETSPLTKKHRKQPGLVERFEPYIAGMEVGNAYTELNDPIAQRERLEKQDTYFDKETSEASSQAIDESFLHALEVGMPPTGGVGLGIERLVMILTDQSHIKDSILFPMLREK